jgi:hypothetical protein
MAQTSSQYCVQQTESAAQTVAQQLLLLQPLADELGVQQSPPPAGQVTA